MKVIAIGCSLTSYFYPTWADITLHHYKTKYDAKTENWGRSGAGNQYIGTRLMEAVTHHELSEGDIVLIQWTNMFREDRYHEGKGWHTPGTFTKESLTLDPFVLNNYFYKDQYEWADFVYCVMRDCAIITSTKLALENLGVKVISTGQRYWTEGYENENDQIKNVKLRYEDINGILKKYEKYIKFDIEPINSALGFDMTPEFIKTRPVCKPDHNTENIRLIQPEVHPLPHEYLIYVKDFVLPALGEKISSDTIKDIEEFHKKYKDLDVIVHSDLGWIHASQNGWADDLWRP